MHTTGGKHIPDKVIPTATWPEMLPALPRQIRNDSRLVAALSVIHQLNHGVFVIVGDDQDDNENQRTRVIPLVKLMPVSKQYGRNR